MKPEELKNIVKKVIEDMKLGGPVDDGVIKTAVADEVKNTLEGMEMRSEVYGERIVKTVAGSVMDMGSYSRPWIKLSPEMEKFVEGFKLLVKGAPREAVEKVLLVNTDPGAGYLVPEEFVAQMVQYDTEPAVIWPRATIWPMNTDKVGFPKLEQRPDEDAADFDHFAGISWAWTEEAASKEETQPEFAFLELIAHEIAGYTELSNTLIEDSAINIINFITGLFRRSYIWYTDRSFIRGNGARCPLGIVSDPAVLTVARQTATNFTWIDALAMDSKLPSVFSTGAIWLMNKKVLNNLRGQVDTDGQPVLQQFYHAQPAGIGMGQITMLLGYPIIPSDGKTYALGTKGDVILCDPRWYFIGDRRRFTLDVSEHFKFRSNRTAIRVCGRLDGQPAFSEAFIVLDDVTSAS